jgi:hypothetical protein
MIYDEELLRLEDYLLELVEYKDEYKTAYLTGYEK